jgi:hypothetical protein
MSCGCGSNDGYGYDGGVVYNDYCNADTPYPSVSHESVPSLIDNLVYALYGTINKEVLGGKVVWDIPCDPNNTATIAGVPRNTGEGLLCYMIRVLNQGINQVNSDWNAVSGAALILNKPTIPAAQVNSDWNAVSGLAQILNKPTIPSAQVNSDWNAVSGVAQILNKPNLNSGKVIYVDSGIGTNTRSGLSNYSFSSPFATIAAAVSASTIGDLVYVKAGSYTITSTISLDNEGDLYFEQDAIVTISTNVVAFSLTADQPKVIGGHGVFICSGTGGVWTQGGGSTTNQQVAFDFTAITNPSGAGTIFSAATGVLVINSTGVVNAPVSTIVSETGTIGNVFYQVLFTACGRLLDMTQANSTMQFTALCWTVQIFGTEGLSVVSGTTSLRFENLVGGTPVTKLVVFKFANGDATFNSHVFRGGRLIANSANPCITFNATTATNKVVKLMGDVQLNTSGANCIVSANARDVVVSSAHASVAADANTTIQGGTLSVSPYFAF